MNGTILNRNNHTTYPIYFIMVENFARYQPYISANSISIKEKKWNINTYQKYWFLSRNQNINRKTISIVRGTISEHTSMTHTKHQRPVENPHSHLAWTICPSFGRLSLATIGGSETWMKGTGIKKSLNNCLSQLRFEYSINERRMVHNLYICLGDPVSVKSFNKMLRLAQQDTTATRKFGIHIFVEVGTSR